VLGVVQGKARFVSDCASYIQSCMKPATDIFISGHEMVASIVVLPLIFKGQTFGGFYGAWWCSTEQNGDREAKNGTRAYVVAQADACTHTHTCNPRFACSHVLCVPHGVNAQCSVPHAELVCSIITTVCSHALPCVVPPAVTLETTSNFQNIKDLLMGFVNAVVLVLHQRLQPQREQIWETILNVSGCAGCVCECVCVCVCVCACVWNC